MYYTIDVDTHKAEGPFTFRNACNNHRVDSRYGIRTIIVKIVVGVDEKEVKD